MFSDDEISRILNGEAAPFQPLDDGPPEVIAETIVRVRLDGTLGELELRIPHDEEHISQNERTIYFEIPDAGMAHPSEARKVSVPVFVRDLERIIDAMQTAVDRARALRLLSNDTP